MKIAILGAGYAGLATAWHLLQFPQVQVDLFDPAGIGAKASGLAAGLLHPFTGMHAKLNRDGREGLESTKQLLAVAEEALGESIADTSGILRIAVTEEQRRDFSVCADIHADVDWWENCADHVNGVVSLPGIFIRSGVVVHSPKYLQGLFTACQFRGMQFFQQELSNHESYDAVVAAMGVNSPEVPLRQIKGQLLEYAWPEELPPLPFALNSKAYLTMSPDRKRVIVGATFERDFSSEEPDLQAALSDIVPKAKAFFPAIEEMQLLDCRAGIRASAPNHLPIVKQLSKKMWVIAGFGSKGLLYHALYSKKLAEKIIEKNE